MQLAPGTENKINNNGTISIEEVNDSDKPGSGDAPNTHMSSAIDLAPLLGSPQAMPTMDHPSSTTPRLLGDEFRLKQVIANFISNGTYA